ncbi:MAG: hypothetical protein AXA67_01245 [Methylothermaceae bacteria B42]|nr:MAG: hypothetical protein AXA67_01245 [Methylothermaceae bacteria B42]HHJ40504.1 copper resistance protein CopC [Methylothermaceae bacterium]
MRKSLLTGVLILFSQAVWSHAILVEAEPGDNQHLAKPPKQIKLRFDAAIGKRYLALAVIDKDRHRVDAGDASRDFLDPSIVTATLASPLRPGEYLVRYRVQSADGHIVTGRYRFIVGEQP